MIHQGNFTTFCVCFLMLFSCPITLCVLSCVLLCSTGSIAWMPCCIVLCYIVLDCVLLFCFVFFWDFLEFCCVSLAVLNGCCVSLSCIVLRLCWVLLYADVQCLLLGCIVFCSIMFHCLFGLDVVCHCIAFSWLQVLCWIYWKVIRWKGDWFVLKGTVHCAYWALSLLIPPNHPGGGALI